MLIRFSLKNVLSFGEVKEFNMIPNSRYTRMANHKYDIEGFEVLKLSAIYGANAAGKSNLFKAINLLKNLVVREEVPLRLSDSEFKFSKKDENQIMCIEYLAGSKGYIYNLELKGKAIIREELYLSGLGIKDDFMLFDRKTIRGEKTEIQFFDEFENDKESQVLKSVIEKNLSKTNKTLLKLLSSLNNQFLEPLIPAYNWFEYNLLIINPQSRAGGLAHFIDIDSNFKNYFKNQMCSLDIGISDVVSLSVPFREFLNDLSQDDVDEMLEELEETPNKILKVRGKNGEEGILIKDGDTISVKHYQLEHIGANGERVLFRPEEESDGTVRLMDLSPAWLNLAADDVVYIIDEIERSIHPLLIKELIRKFSNDDTKGQLIFTTHESNLLDQEIFRQDEIWFAEKNSQGSTDLYSLSDFKEHNTIDIRKGYLTGRYGSIPFLGNLQDLNWEKYATVQE